MLDKAFLITCTIGICACSTVSKMPTINKVSKPDYAIMHIDAKTSNQDLAKAVVISWRQCNLYAQKLENVIIASQ